MSPRSHPFTNLHKSALLPLDGISAKLENEGTRSNQAPKGRFASTILTIEVNKSIAVEELFRFTNDKLILTSLLMAFCPGIRDASNPHFTLRCQAERILDGSTR